MMISKHTALPALVAFLISTSVMAQSTVSTDQTSVGRTSEARAIWVARFSYKTPDDVRAIINNAADHHFNIVIFQVRGNATTFYKSELEPWAWELTSDSLASLGQDPGWDPLALAVELAHERGIELHAWVNFLPGWRKTIPPPDHVDQLWNSHRDWFMQNKAGEVMWPHGWWDYWMSFLDPGVPEVKQHIHDVFLEIVENYDVDGIHYDFVRYPSEVGDWAYNPVSVARFKKHYKDYTDPSPENYPVQWNEWKRSQITEIVHDIYRDAKRLKPGLLVSAAVVRDWGRGHNDYAQDWRTWMSKGILDATFPMLYTFTPENFPFIAQEHLNHAYDRWVLPGINTKRRTTVEILELIELARGLGAPGVCIFGYRATFPDHKPSETAKALLAGPFSGRLPVPEREF